MLQTVEFVDASSVSQRERFPLIVQLTQIQPLLRLVHLTKYVFDWLGL